MVETLFSPIAPARGYKILFVRTSELVQRPQAAHPDLRLPTELAKLDRFDLIILDAAASAFLARTVSLVHELS